MAHELADEASGPRQMNDYATFLHKKMQLGGEHGFAPIWMPDFLFDFQASLVEWALRKGRAAIFADCGLGKTPMQLVWAENIVRKTGGRVLILTPLAVAGQTLAEAEKFGITADRMGGEASIVVVNYQRLHQLDPRDYIGVVCDESSILKHFDTKTRQAVTRFLLKIPYRLLASATPAPNDWSELGSSSEAIGDLTHSDMIERFFEEMDWDERRTAMFNGHFTRRISLGALDTMTGRWRLKGHAHRPFWRWVASWARACRRPSDLDAQFSDAAFVLPPLTEQDHVITTTQAADGELFVFPAVSMRQELDERRRSIQERCETVAALVAHARPAVVWCHLNAESERLARMIPDAVEVMGSLDDDEKEARVQAFVAGKTRVLVTKSKIAGLGLNFQHCAHVVTFATHSFESYYQSIRRCWRYGQTSPVQVDVVWTHGEVRIKERLRRKCERADALYTGIVTHMREAQSIPTDDEATHPIPLPRWLQCQTP